MMKHKKISMIFGAAACMIILLLVGRLSDREFLYAAETSSNNKITFEGIVQNSYTIKKGESKPITVLLGKNKMKSDDFLWSSNEPSIVKVDKQGIITGVKKGNTIIKIRLKGSLTVQANLKVMVGQPVTKLKTKKSTILLAKKSTYQLDVSILPKDSFNKKLGYRSMNPSIVRVDANGKMKAVAAGRAKVLVFSKDGRRQRKISVNVLESCAEYTIVKGKTKNLSTILDKHVLTKRVKYTNYKWISRNSKIVKIEKNKTIKAIKNGSAFIEGNTKSGRHTKILLKVTVGKPSTKIKVASGSFITEVGQNVRLKAKVRPTSATNKKMIYVSENPDIAAVDKNGKVMSLRPGKATIKSYASDGGSSATVSVTVKAPLKRTTTHGMIEGKLINNGSTAVAWLGIPYAKPPVKELRWRAPQDCVPWTGVLATKNYSNKAAQIGDDSTLVGSEDCLYLNIYRPNSAEDNLPVMVYLHGGGNVTGSSHKNFKNLATNSNTIVVSVEFRLGAFGWLNVPALKTGNPEEDSGNFAMLDIRKALQWVNENITQFGGDKKNITLSGYSAGGRNVLACLISPIMDGLYQKMISFSGGMNTITPQEGTDSAYAKMAKILVNKGEFSTKKYALDWLENTATNQQIKEFLYSLSSYELANMYKYTGLQMSNSPQLFTDGYVLPKEGFNAIKTGKYNKVPILLGSSSQEFSTYAFSAKYTEEGANLNAIQTGWSMFDIILAAKKYGSQLQSGLYIERNAENLLANSDQPNVYAYRFNWGNNPNVSGDFYSNFIGSKHGIDIQFICGVWTNSYKEYAPDLYNSTNYPGRKALSGNMQKYISNFLRTGNPNGKDLTSWIEWNAVDGREKVMMFDAGNNRDISKMSPEYLKTEDVFNRMKFSLSSAQYDMLMNYTFARKVFMPDYLYKKPTEEELLEDTEENLTEETFDDVE